MEKDYKEKLLEALYNNKTYDFTMFLYGLSVLILNITCNSLVEDYTEFSINGRKTGGKRKFDDVESVTQNAIMAVLSGNDLTRGTDVFMGTWDFIEWLLNEPAEIDKDGAFKLQNLIDKWNCRQHCVNGGDNSEQE